MTTGAAGGRTSPTGLIPRPCWPQDAAGLLDALGISGAYVVGHSLGGFIAEELTLARPELVSRLVLASTTFGGPNAVPVTQEALAVMMDRSGDPMDLVRRGVAIAAGPGFSEAHPGVVDELVAYRFTGPVPAAQYQAQMMAGAMHNAEDRVSGIACPTLVLFGEHDKVVPPANAALLTAKIAGSASVILPGVGHIFPLEDVDATNAALHEFFSK